MRWWQLANLAPCLQFEGRRLFWKSRQLSMASTLSSLDKTVINLVDMKRSGKCWWMVIWPGASAEEPSSAWSVVLWGGRQVIGWGGLEGQRWAGWGGKSRFRFGELLRRPGSHRIVRTAHGRSVRLPPVTMHIAYWVWNRSKFWSLRSLSYLSSRVWGHRHIWVDPEAEMRLWGARCVQHWGRFLLKLTWTFDCETCMIN